MMPPMNAPQQRRLRRLLQACYPTAVVHRDGLFAAWLPDLPEVATRGADLAEVYGRLEQQRRDYVLGRVAAGARVALPNSHFGDRSAA